MTPERRRAGHVRLPVQIPVVVGQRGPPAGEAIAGETENLSRGGVLLRVGRAESPGTSVRMMLRLRRPVSLTITGTVIWTRLDFDPPGWKQGLQFGEELSETLVAQIVADALPPREGRSR